MYFTTPINEGTQTKKSRNVPQVPTLPMKNPLSLFVQENIKHFKNEKKTTSNNHKHL